MSKKTDCYTAVASSLGLHYDGVGDVIYGKINGFDITLYAPNANYPFMLGIHTAARNSMGTPLGKDEVRELTKGVKSITACKQEGNDFIILTPNRPKQEKLVGTMKEAVSCALSFLRDKGYSPCCSVCGQSGEEIVSFKES